MNNDLYSKLAKDFSRTRSAPWNGWNMLLERGLIPDKPLRILDIGCGNGRFLKFIKQYREIEHYLGIDYSEELLEEAKSTSIDLQYKDANNIVSKINFGHLDINNNTWEIPETNFDLIVAFGIQHHLASFENRQYLLKQIKKLLKSEEQSEQDEGGQERGFGVVTYWQFFKHERYLKKIKKLPGENDYSMSFGKNEDARFCHFTDLDEITKLEEASKLNLVDNFLADGRDNTENIYRVYSSFGKVKG